jgi:ABC-type branched-subunit amino acid transport system ATPase component/ABC-type branched-subunit amino acid transport system permease subunit
VLPDASRTSALRRRLDADLPNAIGVGVGALAVLAGYLLLSNVTAVVITSVIATAIAALGLDILIGRTGQLSLAHAAFLGVGVFTAQNLGGHGLPWPVALVGSMVVAALASTFVGLPALRIRGLQVALATLAFQVTAEQLLFNNQDVRGDGFLERPSFMASDKSVYLFAVACLVATVVVRRRLGATRAGRAFLAVRDVERRVPCFGIDAGPNKLLAYALSGAIAGLAGFVVALAGNAPISDFQPFQLRPSLLLVAVVVLGGQGSAGGIIVAALLTNGIVPLLPQGLQDSLATTVPILSALALILAVRLQPEGIGGGLARIARLIRPPVKPDPRPHDVDLLDAAHHAEGLRAVPRALALTMPQEALLVARDVSVRYGGVNALTDLSLEVRRGEIVGLIGANGAGKSTFFNAASGFAPTRGSIRFKGVELVGDKPSKRPTFGLARTFQDLGLVKSETVEDNMLLLQTWLARYPSAFGILGLGGSLQTERQLRYRADQAMELFGLEHLRAERVGDLPYGTGRIVEIAAAVASGPDLLLLDEATAGLGPEEGNALGDRFLALRDELGLTLVVIEHHVPLIARVCDHCYCLESGLLIAEGPPAEVVKQPEVVASFLGRAQAAGGVGAPTEAAPVAGA